MLVEEAYINYLSKVEENITNDNIATDKQRFVLLFNETQVKFIEALLDIRGDDDIRYIQNFLVPDKRITLDSHNNNRYNFKLPQDYLDLSDCYAMATKEDCHNQRIDLQEIKSENITQVLQDSYNQPSFEWRESRFIINNNTVSVFAEDFKINEILLTYYRYPNRIKQINPENPESNFDESSVIEWDDKATNRILSACAGEFDINQMSPRWQIQKQRVAQKN